MSLFGSLVASIVHYSVWRGDGYPIYEAMVRDTDRPRRSLFILVPLATTAAGGLASNLFFPQFAFVGYLVCGWGDAIAAAAGLCLFGLSAGMAVAAGVACGVFGAPVEAVSNHGLDNFTIQVAASAAAFVLLT